MILVAYVPVFFVVIGALLWTLAPGKSSELGRLLLLAGLVGLSNSLASYVLHVG